MPHAWTIADAKARLSEILRLASTEGPQRIGTQRRYVLVPEEVWDKVNARPRPLGAWLIDNMPHADKDADELQPPDRHDSPRDDPFEPMATAARAEP
jgi:hypothetical protein